MTTTLTGADADELERAARRLHTAAAELDAEAAALTSQLRAVAWVGGVATRFGAAWDGTHRPRVRSTAEYVRTAAALLERNADEQRRASTAAHPDSSIVPPAPPGPPDRGDVAGSPVERLESFLGTLDVGRALVGEVVAVAHALEDAGIVHRLLDVLTSDELRAVLDGFDAVMDARSVLVDLVVDFVEHPGLAFDERLVHAFADAAVRFGVAEGTEAAAEWLSAAATTALLPGFGAVLAPVVGQVAGAIAGEVADLAVDALDGATDGVDAIADVIVDVYRDVKDDFGIVVDMAQVAGDIAAGAADLAGDVGGALAGAGGAVWDAGGATAGTIGGAVSDVAGGVYGRIFGG